MSWFGWGEEGKKEEKKEDTSSSWFSWGNSGETVGQEEGCSESVGKYFNFIFFINFNLIFSI